MNKKSRENAYGDNVLERIQQEWQVHRQNTGLTQTEAALSLGIRQSAFSQYLTGKIRLNTDFISRFAQLVGKPPGYFHQRLNSGSEEWYNQDATIFTGEVKQRLSDGEIDPKYVIIPRMTILGNFIMIEVDNQDSRYKAGSVLCFSRNSEIADGNEVGVFIDGVIYMVGDLTYVNDTWKVNGFKEGRPVSLHVDGTMAIMRNEGMILPEQVVGRRRFRHESALKLEG